jgi:hypothetical protein
MRISVIAAIACIAIVAVVTHSLPSSDVDVSLASSTTVQLCTDKDFAGLCKSAGYGRCACKPFSYLALLMQCSYPILFCDDARLGIRQLVLLVFLPTVSLR